MSPHERVSSGRFIVTASPGCSNDAKNKRSFISAADRNFLFTTETLEPHVTRRQSESLESLTGTFLHPLYLGRPQILWIPLRGALWLLQIAGEINQAKTTTGV